MCGQWLLYWAEKLDSNYASLTVLVGLEEEPGWSCWGWSATQCPCSSHLRGDWVLSSSPCLPGSWQSVFYWLIEVSQSGPTHSIIYYKIFEKCLVARTPGNSLEVQWSGLQVFQCQGGVWSLVGELRSQKPWWVDLYLFIFFLKIFFYVDHFYSLYWICYNVVSVLCLGFFFFFWPQALWDLSFPTRVWTSPPHWKGKS